MEDTITPYLRCKFERHRRGITLRQVVKRMRDYGVKLTANDLSDIERGIRNPRPQELEALAQVFAISPASVLLKPCAIADPETAA